MLLLPNGRALVEAAATKQKSEAGKSMAAEGYEDKDGTVYDKKGEERKSVAAIGKDEV